jgi:hypothetical protein
LKTGEDDADGLHILLRQEKAGVQARSVQVIGNAGENQVLDRSVVDGLSA